MKPQKSAPSYYIRYALPKDVDQMAVIAHDGLLPWDVEKFTAVLARRSTFALVAQPRNVVVGFAVYVNLGIKLQLLNIGTDRYFRRCGVGTALVNKIKEKVRPDCAVLDTYVPESALDIQLFLRSCGLSVPPGGVIPIDNSEDDYRFTFCSP